MIKNWLDKIPVADVEEQTKELASETSEITHGGVRFRVVETDAEVYCSVYVEGVEVDRKVVVEKKGRYYYERNSIQFVDVSWVNENGEPVVETENIPFRGSIHFHDVTGVYRATGPLGDPITHPDGELLIRIGGGGPGEQVPVYEDHISHSEILGTVASWPDAPSYITVTVVPEEQTMNFSLSGDVQSAMTMDWSDSDELQSAIDILREAGLVDD